MSSPEVTVRLCPSSRIDSFIPCAHALAHYEFAVRLDDELTKVTAEKSADAPGDWATVKLTVGVTRDKLRTLVIQFYADTRVSSCYFLSPFTV